MGRAQPGKAVKPPHEDSWPSAPCGHRATAPSHLTANPEWAMGITTHVFGGEILRRICEDIRVLPTGETS